jgi:hypothetical protein
VMSTTGRATERQNPTRPSGLEPAWMIWEPIRVSHQGPSGHRVPRTKAGHMTAPATRLSHHSNFSLQCRSRPHMAVTDPRNKSEDGHDPVGLRRAAFGNA